MKNYLKPITKTSWPKSWTYKYDYQNRLKQVKLNSQTVFQAMYDGDGRRIETIAGGTSVYDYLAGSWDPSHVKDPSRKIHVTCRSSDNMPVILS